MKKITSTLLISTILALSLILTVSAAPMWSKNPKGFEHGLAVNIEGTDYWFVGPGSIAGAVDVPGHTWKQTGPMRVIGRHYNIGPTAVANTPWWASGEPVGVLLYKVDGIIDVPPGDLPDGREAWLKAHGYVHVHEFEDSGGTLLEDYVVYLKHTAGRSFTLDGGPAQPDPPYEHDVTPGIDPLFPPNW
jgi:hypothetical protein